MFWVVLYATNELYKWFDRLRIENRERWTSSPLKLATAFFILIRIAIDITNTITYVVERFLK